jgi:hypothetical protein
VSRMKEPFPQKSFSQLGSQPTATPTETPGNYFLPSFFPSLLFLPSVLPSFLHVSPFLPATSTGQSGYFHEPCTWVPYNTYEIAGTTVYSYTNLSECFELCSNDDACLGFMDRYPMKKGRKDGRKEEQGRKEGRKEIITRCFSRRRGWRRCRH